MNKFLYNHELLVFLTFTTLIVSLFTFEMTIVRQYLSSQNNPYIVFHIIVACYLLVNTLSALYLVVKTNCSTNGLVMPSRPLPGWLYCHQCQANSPPRSYHCQKCRGCILRRDHHCVFTMCCIGHTNYKYFMSLLFFVALGITYATWIHYEYVFYELNSGWNLVSILSQVTPIMLFILGYIPLQTALQNLLVFICYIGWLFTGGLLIYHFKLLLNNQTTFERNKNIRVYTLKRWQSNLVESLGIHWPMTVFVCPLIPSPQPGNGLEFPTFENNKFSQ